MKWEQLNQLELQVNTSKNIKMEKADATKYQTV